MQAVHQRADSGSRSARAARSMADVSITAAPKNATPWQKLDPAAGPMQEEKAQAAIGGGEDIGQADEAGKRPLHRALFVDGHPPADEAVRGRAGDAAQGATADQRVNHPTLGRQAGAVATTTATLNAPSNPRFSPMRGRIQPINRPWTTIAARPTSISEKPTSRVVQP